MRNGIVLQCINSNWTAVPFCGETIYWYAMSVSRLHVTVTAPDFLIQVQSQAIAWLFITISYRVSFEVFHSSHLNLSSKQIICIKCICTYCLWYIYVHLFISISLFYSIVTIKNKSPLNIFILSLITSCLQFTLNLRSLESDGTTVTSVWKPPAARP